MIREVIRERQGHQTDPFGSREVITCHHMPSHAITCNQTYPFGSREAPGSEVSFVYAMRPFCSE